MAGQLSDETNFDEIESYLVKFGEGEIILNTQYYSKGLAVIYLNNSVKKNAMSGRMMVQFRKCIQIVENWKDGKAVLLCGKGGNFCSGGDLDFARASGTQKEALYMSTWMQDALRSLQKLPMLTVCLIQGPTLGGGAEISIHCDFISASDDVKFGFVHGKMGIITAWGGATRLVQKIGERKALDLLLTSKILSAQGCVDAGIADLVVPAGDAFQKTVDWIEQRLQHHPSVIQKFKQVVFRASNDTYENSREFEKNVFSTTWGAEPNRQALEKNIKHVSNKNNSKM